MREQIRRKWQALQKAGGAASTEVGFLVGVGLALYGVAQMHKPSAFILGGIIMCVIAVGAKSSGKATRR